MTLINLCLKKNVYFLVKVKVCADKDKLLKGRRNLIHTAFKSLPTKTREIILRWFRSFGANCCWIIVFHRGQISQTQIKGITEFILLTQTINGEILTYKNMHLSFKLNIEQNVPQYKTAKWLKQLLSKIHTYNLWTWSVRHISSIFTRLKFVTRQGVYSHAGCCVRLC